MMTSRTSPALSPSAAETILYAVLTDIGYVCPGTCQAAAEEPGANVWFTKRSPADGVRRHFALVVLDTTRYRGSLLRWRQLPRRIKDSTSADGIHVAVRRPDDVGHDFAAAATLNSGAELVLCSKLSRTQSGNPVNKGRIERTS